MKAKVKATGKIVDGIPIYYGSEGKGYLDVPVDHDIFDRYDLEEVELLEQPPLPEGLEEAAEKEYPCDKSWMTPDMLDLNAHKQVAFRKGAEWQKDKMLEGAEECDLYYDGDFLAIDLNMETLGYCERDKVRVIVIKED